MAMERRQIIRSFWALLAAGGSAGARVMERPQISKNSTRCEVSEYARTGQVDDPAGSNLLGVAPVSHPDEG
jgi:hypothetical protein